MTTIEDVPLSTNWRTPLRNVRFLVVLLAAFVSLLGDQFTLVAFPWLILKIQQSGVTLGLMLLVAGMPRALLLLAGGVSNARPSPFKTLIWTKCLSTGLLITLATLVFADTFHVWTLYLFAFAIGTVAAFGTSPGFSILHGIVPHEQLQSATSLFMIARKVAQLIGPVLAGALISMLDTAWNGRPLGNAGLGAAFLLDGGSFALSALLLSATRFQRDPPEIRDHAGRSIKITERLRSLWADRPLRNLLLFIITANALFGGPIQLALPILAKTEISNGAAGLGCLISAFGAGGLAGMLISGVTPARRFRTTGLTILIGTAASGLLIMPLGQIHSVWQGTAIVFLVGLTTGFVQLRTTTWALHRAAAGVMGGIPEVNHLIFTAVVPFFACLTGCLLNVISMQSVLLASGGALVLISLFALTRNELRSVDL